MQTVAVDIEGTSISFTTRPGWTGGESPLDRWRVIEGAPAWRERLVYCRPIGNAAYGAEPRISWLSGLTE